MPLIEITEEFADSLDELDPSDAKRVAAFLGKLVLAPDAASLRPEIVHDAADRSIRSFKVTHDLRALARFDGDRVGLLFVARHDRAYARARDACFGCRPQAPVIGVVSASDDPAPQAWLCSSVADLCRVLTARGIVHDLRP